MSEWIRCGDKVPPMFETVLVYPTPTDYIITAMYTHDGWQYAEYELNYGPVEYSCNPTHWHPLPPPPGESP